MGLQWITEGLASRVCSYEPSLRLTELWDDSQILDDDVEIWSDSGSDIFGSEQEPTERDQCDPDSVSLAEFVDVQDTWSRASVSRSPLLFRRVENLASSAESNCFFVG